jgi:hypothetical protein
MTARRIENVIIWCMVHLDYSSGLIPWDDLQDQDLLPYTVYDPKGRLVEVTVKYQESHSLEGWDPIMASPGYHYNLGFIVANPHNVEPNRSQSPKSLEHRKLGDVLTYARNDYIIDINAPSATSYQSTMTQVIVQYTDDENFTRTNLIFRKPG